MPLDASYDQLIRLLSARGLEWLRQRVMDLPEPMPADHPALLSLAQAGCLAPALTGLRGHLSPLEDIARRRLSRDVVRAASERLLDGEPAGADTIPLLLAGRLVAGEDALWRLAISAVADDPKFALPDRLAACGTATGTLLAEAEAVITRALPDETITAAAIESLTLTLMQLYGFGATRPQFSRPRIYGDVFATLLRCADWALRRGCITAVAQTAFCLRLIDPDHDISALIGEIISNQRPDGSFPHQAGPAFRDQNLETGGWPTLMVLAALNIAVWKRWRGARPGAACCRPLTACRDRLAATLGPKFESWAAGSRPALRLDLAASMSRATSENWFLRLDLARVAPGRSELVALSRRLLGDAYSARHARRTLMLDRHWPTDLEATEAGHALRWLRGAVVAAEAGETAPVVLGGAIPDDGAHFDALCRAAICVLPGEVSAEWRAAARRHARSALSALETPDTLTPDEAVTHLDRLCLIAQLVEGEAPLAAAA